MEVVCKGILLRRDNISIQGPLLDRYSSVKLMDLLHHYSNESLDFTEHLVCIVLMIQGALAQRRSNFQGNQFPVANMVARKAAAAPIRNRPYMGNRIVNRNPNRLVLLLT